MLTIFFIALRSRFKVDFKSKLLPALFMSKSINLGFSSSIYNSMEFSY